ncbi:E3 ubiquitin-protein ligase RING1-like [Lotus japonicus]|uniref:E3 ubiquitin-protein ligase RING1-like n=1 Tax=Lotus japonicus TaxID=34305 RepID=UPI0025862D19|nr:E3 ubiquitin-protein ligase RING1-like [Lotus japonicus]
MSSGSGGIKPFFCHVCSRRFTCSDDDSEPFCPICLEGFVEELPPNNPNPNPNVALHFGSDSSSDSDFPFHPLSLFPLLLSSAVDFQNPHSGTRPESDMFDPILFLQNHLQGLRADGANVQFEVDHPGEPGLRLPANLGDYFLGPGLEQLIQQLAENDPNRYGTPPASKDAIEKLPTVTVDDELLSSELNQCAVCQDEFEKGTQVKQMPCKHVYHDECLLPWLQLHNSCPVCRYELPTDDADYENRSQGDGGDGSGSVGEGGSGGSGGGGGGNRPVHRTFRISLRYPFGGGGGDSAQDSGERGWGNRQEGLD